LTETHLPDGRLEIPLFICGISSLDFAADATQKFEEVLFGRKLNQHDFLFSPSQQQSFVIGGRGFG
jgi:hypothetical protein